MIYLLICLTSTQEPTGKIKDSLIIARSAVNQNILDTRHNCIRTNGPYTHSNLRDYVTLDLGSTQIIAKIVIKFQNVVNVNVYVGEHYAYLKCYDGSSGNSFVRQESSDIFCTGKGRYVKIEAVNLNAEIYLCDVQVFDPFSNLITNITVVDDSEYPINQLVDGNFITCQQVFMNNNDRLAWVRIIIPKYISLVTAIKVTRSSTHPLLDVYVWNIVLDRSNSSLKCLSQNSFSPSYQICNGAPSGKYVSLFGAETSFQVCEIELYGTESHTSLSYIPVASSGVSQAAINSQQNCVTSTGLINATTKTSYMIFDINEEQLVTNVSVLLKMPTSFTVSIGDEVTFVDCSLNVVITPVDKKSVICNRTGRYVKIAGTSTSDNIDICHVEIMNKNFNAISGFSAVGTTSTVAFSSTLTDKLLSSCASISTEFLPGWVRLHMPDKTTEIYGVRVVMNEPFVPIAVLVGSPITGNKYCIIRETFEVQNKSCNLYNAPLVGHYVIFQALTSFLLEICEIEVFGIESDKCVNVSCGFGRTCVNVAGSYQCKCLIGYELVSGVCQDINECNNENACVGSNVICTNTLGSYSCSCPVNHTQLVNFDNSSDVFCITTGEISVTLLGASGVSQKSVDNDTSCTHLHRTPINEKYILIYFRNTLVIANVSVTVGSFSDIAIAPTKYNRNNCNVGRNFTSGTAHVLSCSVSAKFMKITALKTHGNDNTELCDVQFFKNGSAIPATDALVIADTTMDFFNLTDGSASTCFTANPDSEGYAWIMVDLPRRVIKVSHLQIIKSDTLPLDVYVGNKGTRSDPQCILANNFAADSSFTVPCRDNTVYKGAFLTIHSTTQNVALKICEVKVYGLIDGCWGGWSSWNFLFGSNMHTRYRNCDTPAAVPTWEQQSLCYNLKREKSLLEIQQTCVGCPVEDHVTWFEPIRYNATITENVDMDILVTRVYKVKTCHTVHFFITAGNHNNTFSVTNTNGKIRLPYFVDYEQYQEFTLTVSAFVYNVGTKTYGALAAPENATVYITVLNQNDNPPRFLHDINTYKISICVDIRAESIVGHVLAEDVDAVNDSVTYYLVNENLYFGISNTTGAIYAVKDISIRTALNQSFLVGVVDDGTPPLHAVQYLNVSFNVCPTHTLFITKNQTFTVCENNPQHVVTITSFPPDQRYVILSGNENNDFELNNTTGALYARPLDRENINFYSLVIGTVDNQGGALVSLEQLVINITVCDENDHDPVFAVSTYTMQNNIQMNQPILKINVTDGDVGENANLTFSLLNQSSPFSIDADTGVIKLKEAVTQRFYTVNVVVCDHGVLPRCSFKQIEIHVDFTGCTEHNCHVNATCVPSEGESFTCVCNAGFAGNGTHCIVFDACAASPCDSNAACFNVNGSFACSCNDGYVGNGHVCSVIGTPPFINPTVYTVYLSSQSPVGTDVIFLKVTSHDVNGNVAATDAFIESGNSDNIFGITDVDLGMFKIYSEGLLTATNITSWILTVSFISLSSQARAYATVNVFKISDNNFPRFAQSNYTVNVNENAVIGTEVLQLNVIHPDQMFPLLQYSILGQVQDFQVNATTGVISIASALDFENTSYYTLFVQAVDIATSPRRFATTFVSINVVNVNDNTPFFLPETYNITVSESILLGSKLLTVQGIDGDSGTFGELTFIIVAGDESSEFRIDKFGNLFTIKMLDFETKSDYQLHIIIIDGGGAMSATNAVVEIKVRDNNEFCPVFESSLYEFDIFENQTVPYNISVLRAVDRDGTSTAVSYSVLENPIALISNFGGVLTLHKNLDYENQTSYFFRVEAINENCTTQFSNVFIRVQPIDDNYPIITPSLITVNVKENADNGAILAVFDGFDADKSSLVFFMDRHAKFNIQQNVNSASLILIDHLDFEKERNYTLKIKLEDSSGKVSESHVIIIVENVDDNQVQFSKSIYTFNVLESAPVGHIIGNIATATDNDANSSITYFVGESSNTFFVANNTFLVLNATLDYEMKKQYHIILYAASATFNATATVIIVVADVNDVPPVLKGSFNFFVKENTEVATVIFTAMSTDPDSIVVYSVLNTSDVVLPFAIDSSTGKVSVTTALDYEVTKNYSFLIQVNDGIFNDTKGYTIQVVDVNDNRPVFSFDYNNISVFENQPVNTVIAIISASDNDAGIFGDVYYKVLNIGENFPFDINKSTGELILTRSLDFESEKRYDVAVTACDVGFNDPLSMCNSMVFSMHVLNVDDVNLSFSKVLYSTKLIESAPPGFSVLNVFAADLDGPCHFNYSVEFGNENNKFYIDSSSGVITIVDYLNSQDLPVYNLTVAATSATNVAYSNVIIEVIAVTGFSFLKSSYEVSRKENLSPGFLLQLSTTPERNVTFELKNLNDSVNFRVNESTGVLSASVLFDYEQRTLYVVDVEAKTESYVAKTVVIVNVLDTDDEKPNFIGPLSRNVTINENAKISDIVATVSATDLDRASNLTYAFFTTPTEASSSLLLDGELVLSPFSIISSNNIGQILVSAPLNSGKATYQLQVMVSDSNGNVGNNKMNINVKVSDVNNNKPTFNQTLYNFSLPEDYPVAKAFGKVFATDIDQIYRNLTYRIVSREIPFDINSRTGEVMLSSSLDYETRTVYNLVVMAEDNGDINLIGFANVHVEVTNVNEHTPVVLPSVYNITEDFPVGVSLLKLKAIDEDVGTYGEVRFLLHESSESSFSVDPVTGDVKLVRRLSDEVLSYSLLITVYDLGIPSLHSNVSILINVIDVNNRKPIFDRPEYDAEIPENRPVNTTVLSIAANDLDLQSNGVVSYRIISQFPDTSFKINENTGLVSTTKELDYEHKRQYTITVQAYDHGFPSLSSVVIATFNVTDQNDNAPVFASVLINVSVPVYLPVFSVVTQVSASDADSANNALTLFSLVQGDMQRFNITPDTGEIILLQPFDSNVTQSHILVVTVRDSGVPPLFASEHALINITSYHNSSASLMFSKEKYIFNISENDLPHVISSLDVVHFAEEKQLFYRLDVPSTKFALQPNGTLEVLVRLDYEAQSSYIFTALVQNTNTPLENDVALIVINVLDIDDESPRFFLPYQNEIHIGESTDKNQIVSLLHAKDPDAISVLNFTLRTYTDVFDIESRLNVGVIRLRKALNCSATKSFMLEISVQDDSGNMAESNAFIFVIVSDENTHCPVFVRNYYNVTISENVELRNIIIVQAFDNDCSEKNMLVRYSIADDVAKKYFKVDTALGNISMITSLNFENKQFYEFSVVATNQASSLCGHSAKILVTVQNVNDNSPMFFGPFNISIPEDFSVGNLVFKPIVKDADNLNSHQFSITSGMETLPFFINQVTGEVYLTEKLDYEKTTMYDVIVRVLDVGNTNTDQTEQNYKLRVEDVNDNRPLFSQLKYSFEFQEETPTNTLVGCASAVDEDATTNGEIQYSLSTIQHTFFTINSTGCIFTNQNIDIDAIKGGMVNLTTQVLVIATDQGVPPLRASKLVSIKIFDMNDNTPEFQPVNYNVSVTENTDVGTSLTQVSAHDLDMVTANLQFFIINENLDNPFRVDTTGRIYLKKPIDFSTAIRTYTLILSVSDGENNSTRLATILINVVATAESAPVFPVSEYILDLPENTPVGHSVLIQLQAANVNATYSFSQSSKDSSRFKINKYTGEVTLHTQLNYEKQRTHFVAVIATSTSSHQNATVQLIVHVTDVNDNYPMFTAPLTRNITIPESMDVGQIVARFEAFDSDSTTNGDITYSIITTNEHPFEVLSTSGVVLLMQPVDAERRSTYSLEVAATDNGVPPRSSQRNLILNIVVEDVNEHCPVFSNDTYTVEVLESAPLSTAVLQVSATDVDKLSPNNVITYTLADTTFFHIDYKSGNILTKQLLDYESQRSFRLIVVATDHARNPCVNKTFVDIKVVNINDNAPVMYPPFSYDVMENVPIGFTVFQISVDDADNESLEYLLLDGNSSFVVNQTTGEVVVARHLDHETKASHNITIRTTDQLFQQTQSYIIQILNVNDNPPNISKTHYLFSIDENINISTIIGCVSSTDKENSSIQYYLSTMEGEISTVFLLDKTSGCLSLQQLVDAEKQSRYLLKIVAVDSGIVQLRTTSTVEVTINDVNDNPPSFASLVYNIDILENTLAGTNLLTLKATDPDFGGTDIINYNIFSGNIGEKFSISNSGQLVLESSLDFENQSSYSLQVVASDASLTSFFDTTTISIHVVNINEHSPTLTKPVFNVSLSESYPVNKEFLQVTAVDKDFNATIMYRIQFQHTTSDDLFFINITTGVLSLKGVLDFEKNTVHTFTVIASNADEPTKIGITTVNIFVNDENDNVPVFTKPSLDINVIKSTNVGTVIGSVLALDADSGLNGIVLYVMSTNGSDVPFSVNETSGEIKLTRLLTSADPSVFAFTIEATNFGEAAAVSSTASISSSVIAVMVRLVENNNAPKFSADTYILTIPENEPLSNSIARITANDFDAGVNGVLSYKIISADENLPLKLNATSAVLSALQSFDYETQSQYTFMLAATDHGYPNQSVAVLVQVNIGDKNEAPVFLHTLYNVSISELTMIGTTFLRLSYSDDDAGQNGEVFFSVVNGNNELFSVESPSGKIILKAALNVKKTTQFSLTLQMYDGGKPSLRSTDNATVLINVVNIVSNQPVFMMDQYVFEAVENYEGIIGRVKTTTNSTTLTYRLLPPVMRTLFSVNSNGSILVIKSLDFEMKQEHHFYIEVFDNNHIHRAKASTDVKVIVIDVNDNLFKLSTNRIELSLLESTQPGTILARLIADDADSGRNGMVLYEVTPHTEKIQLLVTNNTAMLILKQQLDYETQTFMVCAIKTTSVTSPIISTDTGVIINVLDVNDNPPKFEKRLYMVSVLETSPIGSILETVTATDGDSLSNGNITYHILQTNSPVNIDNLNGTITQVTNFDPFLTLSHEITIIVKDSGTPQLRGHTVLRIDVVPVNKHPPVFSPERYEKDMFENSLVGMTLLQVSASDSDFTGKSLVYAIVDGNTEDSFTIDPQGYIIVARNVDREIISSFNLTVSVRDSGNPFRFDLHNASVFVSVLDVNDNSPVFLNTPSVVTVSEEDSAGKVLTTVRAADLDDSSHGRVIYAFQRVSDYTVFDIGETSGDILLKSAIDHKDFQNYTLFIVATDSAKNPRKSFYQIKLNIIDVNSPPFFSETFYNVTVSENAQSGLEIVTVKAQDIDSGVNAKLSFSIVTGNEQGIFGLDGPVLNLKRTLDYKENSLYVLNVSVTDGIGLASAQNAVIEVHVTNVEIAPVFTKGLYEVTVEENSPVETLLTVNASSENPVRYEIVRSNSSSNFFINSLGTVVLLTKLDYEKNKEHRLVVKARSGHLEAETVVIISVTDVNDNTPYFLNNAYSFYTYDDMQPNNLIGQVMARDDDSGINSKLTYNVIENVPFTFNGNVLTNTISLRYDVQKQYTFNVVASDKGVSSHTSSPVTVTVNVLPNNDTSPTFKSPTYTITVAEDITVGVEIIRLSADDPDSGNFGRLVYTLERTESSSLFTINQFTGSISLAEGKMLDYSNNMRHVLVVKATDGTGLTDTAVVFVNLIDKNTYNPTFEKSYYEFSIANDAAIDTSIGQIMAIDKDVTVGHRVLYNILSRNDSFKFRLSPSNGNIIVSQSVMAEGNKVFTLIVLAYNPTIPSRLSKNRATVVIHVIYRATITPAFNQTQYLVNVKEPGVIGEIVQVTASTGNLATDFLLKYHIVNNSFSDVFSIGEGNGKVFLRTALDRETTAKYTFNAGASSVAYDGTDTAVVIVTVLDANDNIPRPLGGSTVEVTLSEATFVGRVVHTVSAVDDDLGENSNVQYTLASNGVFSIDASGIVRLISPLDYEVTKSYNLKVYLSDQGNPPLTNPTPVSIVVTVKNENDVRPRFTSKIYSKTIPESSTPFEDILQVNAVDEDQLQPLMYVLTGTDASFFSLDNNTLWISSRTALVYTQKMKYTFICSVTDGLFTDFASIEIAIADVNNNNPIFETPELVLNIFESTPVETVISVTNVTDEDTGAAGRISLSIRNGDTAGVFGYKDGNKLTLLKQLDYETMKRYILLITATDSGTPQLFSRSVRVVNIINVNDNPPRMPAVPPIFLNEGVYVQQTLHTFTVIDEDNSPVTVQLHSPENLFTVHQRQTNAFALVVTGSVDYESCNVYKLILVLSDGLYQTVSEVIVTVNDLNEPPYFPTKAYDVTISETSVVGSFVTKVWGRDPDAGFNGELRYKFDDNSIDAEFFSINSTTGIISVKRTLDYENKTRHELKVIVLDHNLSSAEKATVTIRVRNNNDNPPMFNQSLYTTVVKENDNFSLMLTVDNTNGFPCCLFEIVDVEMQTIFLLVQNHSNVFVRNKVRMDYETRQHYRFTVSAKHTDSAHGIAIATVSVSLTDVNDNAPQFHSSVDNVKTIEISESLPMNSTVLYVSTSDLDSGKNSVVSLFLSNADDFRMEGNAVVVKNKLSYHKSKMYKDVTITAKDGGNPPLSTSHTLDIHVKQENTRVPQFIPDQIQLSFNEGMYANGFLYQVVAMDEDNDTLTYSIVNPVETVSISESGILTLNGSFNHSLFQTLTMVVKATDGLYDAFLVINLTITDVNEAPVVTKEYYNLTLPETTQIGSLLLNLHAFDVDVGSNGEIRYELRTDNCNIFSVDTQRGEVYLNATLNYESMQVCTSAVNVYDNGSPKLNASTMIQIHVAVKNINEHSPFFNQSYYTFTIAENSAFTYSFLAVDDDISDSISYSVKYQSANNWFAINRRTGVLRNIASLDYEVHKTITLVIEARDSELNYRVGHTTVIIILENMDDNPLVLENKVVSLSIKEDMPIGSVIYNFVDIAKDEDVRFMENMFSYHIQGGNVNEVFGVKNKTQLYINNGLDFETFNFYNLTIIVNQTNALSANIFGVLVTVKDVNEHSPTFAQTSYKFNVLENTPFSRFIDANDSDRKDEVRYHILNSTAVQYFVINSTTGEISNSTEIDYETMKAITFTVIATDTGVNSRYGCAEVSINVIDVNDNLPYFLKSSNEVNISRTTLIGTQFFTMQASDADSGSNGKLQYFAQYNQYVQINRFTGVISLTRSLEDVVGDRSFFINLNVSDRGNPPLWSNKTCTLRVNVIDTVEFFNTTHLVVNIEETNMTNQNIIQVNSSNIIGTQNVTYAFTSQCCQDGVFTINSITGLIRNARPLDYEKHQFFNLLIAVFEQLRQVLTIHIRVNLIDKNDNYPVFSPGVYEVGTSMDSVYVTRVFAKDADSGSNGELSYTSSHAAFSVDKDGYMNITNISLLKDVSQVYFTVSVRDNGSPNLNATLDAQMFVTITGRKEPQVAQSVYRTSIHENTTLGSSVLTVSAKIPDGHGAVEYTVEDEEERLFFMINKYNGLITTKKAFNYDISTRHKFPVVLRNSLDTKKVTIATVIVSIIDVNNNAPVFVTQSKDVFIEETAGLDRLVAVVSANDVDKGENSRITYAILNGNTNNAFKVNSLGEVRVNATLNPSVKNFYSLILRAKDNGIPKRFSANITLRITVRTIAVMTTKPPVLSIPITQHFEAIYEEYDVDLQADYSGDADYGYYSTLPRASWYDVNYKKDINKNYMRKYLAYTVKVEVGKKNATTVKRRRRRATTNSTNELNLDLEIGTQTECPSPRDKSIPCNGPVQPGVTYRYQLSAKLEGKDVGTFAANSTEAAAIVQATTNLPSTNNNSGNAYYILGLSTLGVLLVMALMALAVLLLHPEWSFVRYERKDNTPSSAFTLPLQINESLYKKSKDGSFNTISTIGFEPFSVPRAKKRRTLNIDDTSDSVYIPRAARYNNPIYNITSSSESLMSGQSSGRNLLSLWKNRNRSRASKQQQNTFGPTSPYYGQSSSTFDLDPTLPVSFQPRPVTGPGTDYDGGSRIASIMKHSLENKL